MARCRIRNPKTLRKYERLTGLRIRTALVRGNTGHRVDILTTDDKSVCWWPDGTCEPMMDGFSVAPAS